MAGQAQKTWQAALLALAAVLFTASPAAAQCSLRDMQWLQGVWQSRDGKTVVEERWTVLPSDQLMGSAWSAHIEAPGGSAEAETILDDGGTVTLRLRHFDPALAHAREDKDAPMVFTSTSCGADQVVFDGQGDRAGEHIAYRRAGDTLTFIGDFLHQRVPIHVVQNFVRVAP
ncbi:MAG TPA: DUF6265 family protein [Rhizomicrobium sp.]|jgi:hypothetical protein|nr:DUF6265 family protein [Rhizomicrobium sp.]